VSLRRLGFAALALAPGLLVGAAIVASPSPPACGADATPGCWASPLGQRLLYVHVPLAWGAYAGFGVAAIGAGLVLARSTPTAGCWMRAAIETTTVYATAALASGLAWSYEFALYDPLADPKVITTIVLALAAGGLWTLATSARRSNRERVVAALTILGVAAVPASYYASRLSVHPEFAGSTSVSPRMGGLLAIATLGFTSLGAAIVWLRARVLRLEEAKPW